MAFETCVLSCSTRSLKWLKISRGKRRRKRGTAKTERKEKCEVLGKMSKKCKLGAYQENASSLARALRSGGCSEAEQRVHVRAARLGSRRRVGREQRPWKGKAADSGRSWRRRRRRGGASASGGRKAPAPERGFLRRGALQDDTPCFQLDGCRSAG